MDPISGEKNKVQVMLTINATVLGSKQTAKEAEVDAGVDPAISDAGCIEDGGVVDAAD